MAVERQVTAHWHGEYRCDVEAGEFTIPVDEPASAGGTNEGPQPTDLLLASVASCFTLALSHSAMKREIEVRSLSVSVTGTYEGPRFSRIAVQASVDCDPDALDGLVAAAKRICYVTNTIAGPTELDIDATAGPATAGPATGDQGG